MPELAEGQSDLSLLEVLDRRIHSVKYEAVSTNVKGLSLRVEKDGTIPELTTRALGKLAIVSKSLAEQSFQVDSLEEAMQEPGAEIRGLAYSTPGFRGIEFQEGSEGFVLAVTPTYTIGWNYAKLRRALGVAYGTVVTETLKASFNLPLGRETPQGPLTARLATEAMYVGGLSVLGFTKADLEKLGKVEAVPKVDEKMLGKMVSGGQVKLANDVGTVGLAFKIEATPLRKEAKK